MKKILLIGLSVLSLSACDTLSNIKMPDMGTLNPFDGKAEATAEPALESSASSADIEIAEMQRLMGNTPRFDTAPTENTASLDPAEPAMEIASPSVTEMNTPVPANKPNYATPQKQPVNVEAQPVTQQTILAQVEPTPVTEKQAIVPTVATIPAADATPKTITVQDIAPVTAVAPTPATTSEIAIFNEQDLKLSSAKGCPQIEILPAGRSITYFENELSGALVARAVINEIRGGCEIVNGGLEIDLDIFMDGKISQKGRFEGRQDMEAFMTFPYFVAVSDPQGLPVDKKIMATAMRFKPIVNDLKHAEKITQFIPMDNTNNAANYKILVGFQLNRKQLEYNRALNVNRVDNRRISPDTIPAARRSTNPLAE
jgi:hypothetical protein